MNAWSEKIVILKHRATLAIALTTFLVNVSGGVILPLLPLLVSQRGASPLLVGAIFSANGIGRTVAQLPAGWLSDRLGDRRVLMVSILVLAGLTLLYAIVLFPAAFVLIGLTMGLVEGFVLPATFSATSRVSLAAQRGQAIGTILAFSTGGFAIGTLIAGAVTRVLSYEHSIVLSAAVCILGVGIIYFGLSKPPKIIVTQDGQTTLRANLRTELTWLSGSGRLMPLVGLAVVAFYSDFVFSSLESTASLYVIQVLAGTVMQVSLLFTISLLTFSLISPVAGVVSDRIGKARQIGLALMGITVLLLLVGATTTYLAFLAVISLEFLMGALMTVGFQTAIGDLFTDEGAAGRAYGLVGTLKAAGLVSGALAATWIFERVPRLTYPTIAVVGLVCLIVFILLWKRGGGASAGASSLSSSERLS